MANQILVPSLGESVTEATVSKWLKQVGDKVNSDEPLVELETDKVNVEVPSPLSGTLSSIEVKEGDTVEVGAILGLVSEGKSAAVKTLKEDIQEEEEKTYTPPKAIRKEKPLKEFSKKNKKTTSKQENLILVEKTNDEGSNGALILDTLAEEDISNIKTQDETDEISKTEYIPPKTKEHLSPSVRKIAQENNIDISTIEGTGKDGRISKGDLINSMGNSPKTSKRKITHGPEERVKMTRLRITIAKRLKEAQDNAAMLTTFNEVDMHSIMEMRKDYKEDFQKKYSVKLGFMSFFVKAAVVALKNFPAVNAEIESDHIIYKNYYNISVAIGTDRGLVVPVLKKADELSFADIERNIFLLSEKAKKGKITINDLQGGTFTISNGGIYGSMLSTPILNPPQTGILGMHNIVERPIVKNNTVIIRPIMYLALSYDHRIIDGKEAVSFLKTIKECLEEPRRLFLDL
jgi:2-oxoglutarate dehydrogenase E2 component (dihydrolipoamide succinyltransferase)